MAASAVRMPFGDITHAKSNDSAFQFKGNAPLNTTLIFKPGQMIPKKVPRS
jgi:hypothetical protein